MAGQVAQTPLNMPRKSLSGYELHYCDCI